MRLKHSKAPRFDESYYSITPCSDLVLMDSSGWLSFGVIGGCCRVRLSVLLGDYCERRDNLCNVTIDFLRSGI